MPMRKLILPSLLVLVACKSGPTNVVDLTIVADASVTAAMQAATRSLTIAVGGVESNMKTYAMPSTGLPKQETVQLLPKVTSGMLNVTVTALDKNKVPLAEGMRSVTLTGKEVPLGITLSMVAPPVVTIAPQLGDVTVGKTIPFSANLPVKWSVTGGSDPGTIDANGNYSASMTPGTYTIGAVSVVAASANATAKVVVHDYGVTTLIGTLGGAGELDGAGGAARFNQPYALATDGNGKIFVGDRGGCTLRQIDSATNHVTTLGGDGGVCVSSDGMLGTTATFAAILSMAYDAANNVLYVDESFPGGLRKVSLATGTVQTLVDPNGGVTWGFFGLAYDATAKVLYGARRQVHTIQKVDLGGATPVSSLFAGMPMTAGGGDTATGPATMAQLNRPAGLALDGGNLYVADEGNNEIRKIVVASGITSTLAGVIGPGGDVDGAMGTGTLNLPFGLAVRPGAALYVTESGGAVVRVVALSNGSLSTLAGVPYVPPAAGMPAMPQLPVDNSAAGGKAQFGPLAGAVFDGNATLYVAENFNNVVRAVAIAGVASVQTIAGTPASLGSSDGPGTAARFWNIGTMYTVGRVVYISDNGNATIRKYDFDTGMLSTIAGSAGLFGNTDDVGTKARFQRPEGLFVDGNILYITDGSDSTIRAMDLTTKLVTTLAGTHQGVGFSDGPGSSARFSYPVYVTGDHMGHLYISDLQAPMIRQLDIATKYVSTVAGSMTAGTMDGTGTGAQFQGPYGLTVEGGVLYIADVNTIRAATRDTFKVTTVVGGSATTRSIDGYGTGARVVGVSALAGDGLGHIYFGDLAMLRRFDVGSTRVSTIIGAQYQESDQEGTLSSALVSAVSGIAFTPTGDLLYEDSGASVVMLVRQQPAP